MTITIERTLTAAEFRAQIDFDEAVLAEASKIMHYTKEQLAPIDPNKPNGFGPISASLLEAWQTDGQTDTFEAFVSAVFGRLQSTWYANSDHVIWFELNFNTEIDLEEAVNGEVWEILDRDVDGLVFTDVDDSLRSAWNRYADGDTYIAFVDKVRKRLVKLRGADDDHVKWFTAKYPSKG